jgi:hypothetical protein
MAHDGDSERLPETRRVIALERIFWNVLQKKVQMRGRADAVSSGTSFGSSRESGGVRLVR